MSNYTSMAQPLIYATGSDKITDDQVGQIVDLALRAFVGAQRVTTGGLFMLHGLIVTVEKRF